MPIFQASKRLRLAAALGTIIGVSSAMHTNAFAACAPTWADGGTYSAGTQVTYNGTTYQALVTHTAHLGANWNPAQTASLWRVVGPADCSGGSTGGGTGGGGTDSGTGGGTGGGTGTTSQVCFYQNANFGGTSLCKGVSTGNMGTGWNDRVSSIRVGSGLKVDVYQHANFGGTVKSLTADNANLTSIAFNDTISSYKITAASTGGGNTGGGNTGGGGTCTSTTEAWSATKVYTGGMRVSLNGQIYEAKWWTQGENPASGTSGVWKSVGADNCGTNGGGGTDGGGNTGGGNTGGGNTGGGNTGGGNTGGGTVDTTGWPKPLQGNNVAYNNNGNHVVASYFVEWGVYGRNYHVENIPAANLTHILYGFIPICGPNDSLRDANPQGYSALQSQCAGKPNYTVTVHDKFAALEKSYPGDKWDDPIRGNFGQLRKLKASNPHIKILPSVGGWTLSDPFYSMASSAANRATFVNSMVEFLRTYDFFDGVDIDWEYPGGGGANAGLGSSADRNNYATLMQELRAALNKLGTEKGRKYQLTSAVGAAPSKIAAVNYAQAIPSMDYVFAMSYDYYGAWDNNPGHHAGLYAGANELLPGFNANSTITNLMNAGVPANKLVMGVAMYGRGWKGVTGAVGGNPFYGTGNGPIAGTWEPGVLDYKAIETQFLGGANGTGANGFTYGYDTQAQAPYLWRSSTGDLITFENNRSAKAKGQYAQTKGLAGVFSWEIDADNGTILNAMHEGLGHSKK